MPRRGPRREPGSDCWREPYRSAKGFDHLSQVTIIDAAGVVHGQVYGEAFATPHLVEPLKELVLGTAAPFSSLEDLIKRVRLYCTIYDPAADRYRFDYSLFMQIAIGAVNVGVLLVVVARGWACSPDNEITTAMYVIHS